MLERVRKLCPSRVTPPLLGLLLLVYSGCSEDTTTEPSVTRPTLLQVGPKDFLGNVPCGAGAGLQRYVASAYDVTAEVATAEEAAAGGAGPGDEPEGAGGDAAEAADAAARELAYGVNTGAPAAEEEEPAPTYEDGTLRPRNGFKLPSALPASCGTEVGFGLIVPGRRYRVRIDGYDTDQLAPRASGSRIMVPTGDPNGLELTPTWRGDCPAILSSYAFTVRVRDCETLDPQTDALAPAELRVPTLPLLGSLECGSEPGQVERLTVTLPQVGLSADVACGEEAIFSDLAGGQSLSASVAAFSAESPSTLAGSECHALTVAGGSVVADCPKLSSIGTLRLDLVTALGELGLACDASVTALVVQPPGDASERRVVPPDCLQPLDLGLPGGPAIVTVAVEPAEAAPALLACHGDVVPGGLVVAKCEPAIAN